jgi:hypothetical protein
MALIPPKADQFIKLGAGVRQPAVRPASLMPPPHRGDRQDAKAWPHSARQRAELDLEAGRLFSALAGRGRLQEPDGRLEESTEESTVGPYHAGCRTNAAYSNLAMPEKCLTKIGSEAGRHCGDVVGIGWIGFVAVRAWCARSAAPAGTITQERAISMIFANPASIVAPGAVPHRRARSTKGKSMSVQALGSKGFALR